MDRTENRRVRMTKQLLRDSLLELLQTEEIHKISIRALCQRADLNRSTFYKYYGSQYDLLKEMEDDLLIQIEQTLSDSGSDYTDIARLVSLLFYLRQHLPLCKMLINSNVDPDFPKRLLYLPSILARLQQGLAGNSGVPAAYLQDCILYGGFQMVKRWLNTGCAEPPEQMAQMLADIMQKLLS